MVERIKMEKKTLITMVATALVVLFIAWSIYDTKAAALERQVNALQVRIQDEQFKSSKLILDLSSKEKQLQAKTVVEENIKKLQANSLKTMMTAVQMRVNDVFSMEDKINSGELQTTNDMINELDLISTKVQSSIDEYKVMQKTGDQKYDDIMVTLSKMLDSINTSVENMKTDITQDNSEGFKKEVNNLNSIKIAVEQTLSQI
jgi:hypothetical protein